MDRPDLLTIDQAAVVANRHRTTILWWEQQGWLSPVTVRGRRMYRTDQVIAAHKKVAGGNWNRKIPGPKVAR